MRKQKSSNAQRAARARFKRQLAEIVDKAIHDAFEKAAFLPNEGSPRSGLDFMRWFVKAVDERMSGFPRLKPR